MFLPFVIQVCVDYGKKSTVDADKLVAKNRRNGTIWIHTN